MGFIKKFVILNSAGEGARAASTAYAAAAFVQGSSTTFVQ